ncbi:Pumilio-like protein 3 [Gryllus bimaculatus]|nr:Pumilio-like protein 3 [Gryllus bimaculatus]
MAKKSRIAGVSVKQNHEGQGKLSKSYKNRPKKRKAIGETTIDSQESTSKKVRFSISESMPPESSRQSKSESNITKRERRAKEKLPRFMKPELRTIKKSGSIFDKVQLTASGKPNWVEIKKESSKIRRVRKEKKQTHFEIILQVKKIWEMARHENFPVDKRAQEIVKLHSLVQNQLNKLIYAHDTSRIVQGLLRLGSQSVRTSICDELAPEFTEMMQKKFSAFIIKSILKYCDGKWKTKVLESMKGSIVKLMTNSASAPLVDHVYAQIASPDQKISMEKEFFGSLLLTVGEPATGSIPNILSHLNAENKAAVFESIKENIVKVTTKGNFSALLCQVTLHFIEECSQEDKQEVLSLFSPHILDFVHTKPGSRLAMQCVWHLGKKVRKQIVKKMKGNIETLASSENSFWIILALLDAVDDTVLLNKVLGENTVFNGYREELSPVVDDFLLRISKEVEIWLENPKVAMVTLAALKKGQGEKLCKALQAIARYICSDVKLDNQPLIENPGMNLILKKLLKMDDLKKDDSDKFSVHLASVLEAATIKKWISCNRGAFLLVGILEAKSEEATKTLVSKITRPLKEQIRKAPHVGAKVLIRVLKEVAPDLGDWELTNTDD